MNVAQAAGFLGERFGDLAANKFNDALRRLLLQNAEIDLANKLHPAYLTELETLQESVSLSSGSVALSTLTYDVLKGAEGIMEVKLAGGKICTKIDPLRRKETESFFRQGSTEDPYFFVRNNKIYVLPAAATSIDVVYRKVPDPLYYLFALTGTSSTTGFVGDASQGLSAVDDAYNGTPVFNIEKGSYHVVTDYVGSSRTFTVSPAAGTAFTTGQHFRFLTHGFDALTLTGVNFSLNEGLHEIILTMAEAAGWAQTEYRDRGEIAWKKAVESINVLNAQYKDPDRLGTQQQGR